FFSSFWATTAIENATVMITAARGARRSFIRIDPPLKKSLRTVHHRRRLEAKSNRSTCGTSGALGASERCAIIRLFPPCDEAHRHIRAPRRQARQLSRQYPLLHR